MQSQQNEKQEKEHDTWKLTLAPPADSPKMVMLSGFPPKERMFLCTQARAACWSQSPKFPENQAFLIMQTNAADLVTGGYCFLNPYQVN